MLRRNDYRLQPLYFSVFILDRNLTFAVGTKIVEFTRLSHLGKFTRKFMRKRNGKRHIFLGFVGGVTEHHTLIARAESIGDVARFAMFNGVIHA